MSDHLAIQVRDLAKRYRIGRQERYRSLRDSLQETFTAPFRAAGSALRGEGLPQRQPAPEIWALDGVSFEVAHGEVLGIIGRNGAGKSTLLKLLSRITEPTRGSLDLWGRIGSLLEVGTGFHPELTGRENVYLNGAILGMHRTEIERKFDEIVAFAEIEPFIDTPVKFYSSGMYMRLAFSVAAHLEPEILLVDEVLAVGDAAFQQKCLGKMGDVARAGRTVLFVSHNMAAVQRLCNRAILLEHGRIIASGNVQAVTDQYLNQGLGMNLAWEPSKPQLGPACIERVYLADEDGNPLTLVTTATPVSVVAYITVRTPRRNLQLTSALLDANGEQIFGTAPQDSGLEPPTQPGRYRAVFYIPEDILLPKTYGYKVVLWERSGELVDTTGPLRFNVEETASFINAVPQVHMGQLAMRCKWTVEKVGEVE